MWFTITEIDSLNIQTLNTQSFRNVRARVLVNSASHPRSLPYFQFSDCLWQSNMSFMRIVANVFLIWEEMCLKMINNRDSTMAALLFAIVLVFFVCHTPKAVINIYEVKIYIYITCIVFEPLDSGRTFSLHSKTFWCCSMNHKSYIHMS